MNIGDKVQWQGANKVIRGTVVMKNDILYVELPNKCLFRLSDVQQSKSFSVVDEDPWAFLNDEL